MTSLCVSPIKGRVMRIIKLDVCGNPVTGASSAVIVMDGFVSMKATPVYEDGTEYVKKRADGTLCVNTKDPGQLKRVTMDGEWCVMDPDAIVTKNGARLLSSGVTGTGAVVNNLQPLSAHYSLELWQAISGVNACTFAGAQQYVYWAFPNVTNCQIQDFTFQNDVFDWKETSEAFAAGLLWGTAPTANPPNTYLGGSTFVPGDVYAYNVTSTPPPAAACGAVLLA